MKIRTDFVTNSSSSSFVLARKGNGEISQKGKERLLDILLNEFFPYDNEIDGDVTLENIDTHEDISYLDDDVIANAKTALQEGYELLGGTVSWEETEYRYGRLAEEFFNVFRDEDNYRVIDADMSY